MAGLDPSEELKKQLALWGPGGSGWSDPANIGKSMDQMNALGANTSASPGVDTSKYLYQGYNRWGTNTPLTQEERNQATNLGFNANVTPSNEAEAKNLRDILAYHSQSNAPTTGSNPPGTYGILSNPTNTPTATPSNPGITPNSMPVTSTVGPSQGLVNNMTTTPAPAISNTPTISQAPTQDDLLKKKLSTFGGVQ